MKLSQLPMVGWTHWCSSSQDSWYWIRHGGNCWNWCGKQAGLTPALVCDRFKDAKHYCCWYLHCFLFRDDINLNVISLEFSQTKIVRICVTTLGAVTYPSGTVWSQGDCDCFKFESNKYSFEIIWNSCKTLRCRRSVQVHPVNSNNFSLSYGTATTAGTWLFAFILK